MLRRAPTYLWLALASGCGDDSQGDTTTSTSAPTVSVSGITLSGEPTTTAATGSSEAGASDTDAPTTTLVTSGSEVGGEPPCDQVLRAKVRDFKEDHPDFEYELGSEKGIVLPDLGADDLPVYASDGATQTTTGRTNFDQWFRDVPGVNQAFELEIGLQDTGGGNFGYDNAAFFPIDGTGFGDEGHPHNYHFTLELHTEFVYRGGEVFRFRGDDDLFVFINKKLAMDLGGVHGPEEAEAVLDDLAGALGIAPGGTYQLDFFFAERHTTESNFRIETTIECLSPPIG